jgi:hypothetical protein
MRQISKGKLNEKVIIHTIKSCSLLLVELSTHPFADITSSVVGRCIGGNPADWVRIKLEATPDEQHTGRILTSEVCVRIRA